MNKSPYITMHTTFIASKCWLRLVFKTVMPHYNNDVTQKEEIYARQFYQELKNEFWSKQNPISKFLGLKANESKSDIDITLKEAGTQSDCTTTRATRQCSIHCFDID